MIRLLPLAALVALSLAGPAQAGLFDDADARRQIAEMRQDLESRLETSSRGQLELANQNEQLRAEIAKLRGQLEVVLNEVESLKQRQRDFYVDLDLIEGFPSDSMRIVARKEIRDMDYLP